MNTSRLFPIHSHFLHLAFVNCLFSPLSTIKQRMLYFSLELLLHKVLSCARVLLLKKKTFSYLVFKVFEEEYTVFVILGSYTQLKEIVHT